MRELINLVEMATVRGPGAPSVLYHGTSNNEAGLNILKTGLRPGNTSSSSRGHMKPVVNRVYLTPSLNYAVIYCLGGVMMGHKISDIMMDGSRWGWLFVVDTETLVHDAQPDEDSVGEAAMFAHRLLRRPDCGQEFYHDSTLYNGLKSADRDDLSRFGEFCRWAMTARQYKGAIDGLVPAQASGGKRALKSMPEHMKQWLLSCGAHVAYAGSVMPDQAWRFDKTRSVDLSKDGGNFFDLAERIA